MDRMVNTGQYVAYKRPTEQKQGHAKHSLEYENDTHTRTHIENYGLPDNAYDKLTDFSELLNVSKIRLKQYSSWQFLP